MQHQTEFSPCRKYRYTLWREFYPILAIDPPLRPLLGNEAHNYLMVIGLNPSTADETKNDPTIRRCMDFAKRWGYGALCMTNLFAYRDTNPESMKQEFDPVGPENDKWILDCAHGAGMILAAWGKHGIHNDRATEVVNFLEEHMYSLRALQLNKDGTPRHPLYVSRGTKPVLFY